MSPPTFLLEKQKLSALGAKRLARFWLELERMKGIEPSS